MLVRDARAIEVGRWTVNGAVSGISAFVDPSGRIVASEELFEPAILRDTIRSSTQRTWYVRLGDWVPWLLLAFLVIVFAFPRRRASKHPDPEPLPEGYRTLVILPTYEERATIYAQLDATQARADADFARAEGLKARAR